MKETHKVVGAIFEPLDSSSGRNRSVMPVRGSVSWCLQLSFSARFLFCSGIRVRVDCREGWMKQLALPRWPLGVLRAPTPNHQQSLVASRYS
eukprot:scaffold22905_cov49-Prasinocladus_malaysianus.AAC.1